MVINFNLGNSDELIDIAELSDGKICITNRSQECVSVYTISGEWKSDFVMVLTFRIQSWKLPVVWW
jgi:hypothetical protein